MARTVVATQESVDYVVVPALTAPIADGDAIDAGRVLLVVDNASAGDVTVTVVSTAEAAGLAVEDLAVTVAAGTQAWIGPFAKNVFGQPSGANESGSDDQGRVYVDYTAVADVSRAVVTV